MSPQIVTAIARSVVITLVVFAIAFATNKSHGADNLTALWQSIITAGPVALGFLGYGVHDSNRAAQVRAGDLNALHRADVGADLLVPHN